MNTKEAIEYVRKRGQRIIRSHIDEAIGSGFLTKTDGHISGADLDQWARRGCPTKTRSLVWPEGTDAEFEAYVALQETRLPWDRLELARFCARQLNLARLVKAEVDRLRRENCSLRLELERARSEAA